ncbi:MAG: hypothetical protein RL331_368 [Bacteroidota bacterium]|jgi:hypothetical protein
MRILALLFGISFFTIASAQLSNGLIAMFPFDQNFNDLSSNQIVLNPQGTNFTTDRTGIANQGLAMGAQNYITFADAAVKVPLPVTISIWVNVQSDAAFNTIFMSDNVYNNYYGYWLNIAANTGQIGLHLAGGLGGANPGNRRSFLTNAGLSLNEWHHIVGIINSAQDMKIYIDCEQQAGTYSGTGSNTMVYSNAESGIGYYIGNSTNANGAFLMGKMDQLVLWNRALNLAEVRELCENDNPLEVQEAQIQIGIYPNPFQDELILTCNSPDLVNYSVLDLQGKLLQSGEINSPGQHRLNLSDLNSGSYLFQISKNGVVQSKKIVKL